MSKTIQEITKIVSKTTPDGEINFEPMNSEVADKLNGTEITDSEGNKVKIKDTGKVVSEVDEKSLEQPLELSDIANLTKDLDRVVQDTLREHGDEVAYTEPKFNRSRTSSIIYVHYKQDPDNPGKPSEDRFEFNFENSKVFLGGEEICTFTKQSGTLTISGDIAKNNLMKFLNSSSTVTTGEESEELSEELLLGFRKAVDAYKSNPKDKETVKELFRQARNFKGNTIQGKLKNAIEQYLGCKNNEEVEPLSVDNVAVEPPTVSTQDDRTCSADVTLSMSLLIRILEFVKDDMPDDDVLLHTLAENLDKICKAKGQVCMSDYGDIISGIEDGCERCEGLDEELELVDSDSDTSNPQLADVLYRARNYDEMVDQKMRDELMEELSNMFNAPESLDNSVAEYIKHTIPEITVDDFKEAVDRALSR